MIAMKNRTESSVTVIRTDDVTWVKETNRCPVLEELQKWVGGYIEVVKCDTKNILIIVNDDRFTNKLAYNRIASDLIGIELYGNVVVLRKMNLE